MAFLGRLEISNINDFNLICGYNLRDHYCSK